MKELIFLRHAKSDWGTQFLKDIDRHLNERGYRDAYMLSQWLSQNQPPPDLILCSSATRTLSTALIFARAMEFHPGQIHIEPRIYEAPVSRLVDLINEQDDANLSIMLVGHNPGFTDACNVLSKEDTFDNVPTCGLVSFSFDLRHWADIGPKKGKLNYYQFPKEFKNQV